MIKDLPCNWFDMIKHEFNKDYFMKIETFVDDERKKFDVFPPEIEVFSAFKFVDYDKVKIVIIGQDPYHDYNQAHGLCFSVKPGVKIPPSLRNIYKELQSDLGCYIPNHGCLESWARQGVLMINAVMTVRAHNAASHSKIGWQIFTDKVIEVLSDREEPVIFLLWGNYARNKKSLIDQSKHLIVESAHPSPLSASRGFMGSKPFSKINKLLSYKGLEPINWQIEERWTLDGV